MSRSPWLKSVQNWFRQRKQPVPFRGYWAQPRLELLEDRIAPAVIDWTGGSGNFTDSTHWVGGVVPGPSDDAVINVAGVTVTHDSGITKVSSLTSFDTFVLSGGSLTTGALQAQNDSTFLLQGGTLANTTVVGSTLACTGVVSISGALLLSNSTINLGNATGTIFGELDFSDSSPQLLDGLDSSHTGAIVFGPSAMNRILDNNVTSTAFLTLGANLTVQGADGDITALNGMDFKAAVTVDPTLFAGQTTGLLTLNGANWTNDGFLTAQNGGTLKATGFSNFSGGALTGGAWQAVHGGTLNLVGANIATLAANVLIDGAGSLILSNNGGANVSALAGLTSIAAGGNLTVQNGFNVATAGNLGNSGSLTLGPSSTLTVDGNYAQASGGNLSINIGGHSSTGQFGTLSVTGTPVLDGHLNIGLVSGFLPNSSDSYPILTFAAGSRLTDFAGKNGLTFPGGMFDAVYGNNNLTLSVSTGAVIFVTAAQTLAFGYQPSALMTVLLEDGNGRVVQAGSGGVTLTLSSTSSQGVFLDSGGKPLAAPSVTIGQGSCTASFEYLDPSAGTPTLTVTAAAAAFSAATQQETFKPASFVIYGRVDNTIWEANLDGSSDTEITTGSDPRLSPDGRYLIFHRGASPYHYFNNTYERDLLTGQETEIFANNDYNVNYSFTPDSSHIIFDYQVVIDEMNRDGSGVQNFLQGADAYDDAPNVNPQNGMVAFHNIHYGLFVANADGSGRHQIPNTQPGDLFPTWSPDGQWISFERGNPNLITSGSSNSIYHTPGFNFFKIHPDGTGLTQLTFVTNLTSQGFGPTAPWTSDGKDVVAQGTTASGQGLYLIAADGSGTMTALAISSGAAAAFAGTVVGSSSDAPAIISANATAFSVGGNGSFSVQTTGSPLPALTESGKLPSGVTFTDNHDGTATIAGTPLAATGGTYAFTITATSSAGGATQSFTLTVKQAPIITSNGVAIFVLGNTSTFAIQTTGFPTPSLSESGTLPGGVAFADNHDGTASLSGIPAAGSAGIYALTIMAANGVGSNATQSFTLTVGQAPAITSASNTAFAVGVNGSFTVHSTGYPAPSLSIPANSLPANVTFTDNSDGSATLGGTPATGTGGTYTFTVTASNGIGSAATQNFTLTVNLATHFAITAPATVTSGTPFIITVNALDFANNPVGSYTGTVHLTSSDGQAVLPSDQLINGSWPFGVTLTNVGSQSITVADSANALTGTTGLTIAVQPAVDTWINPAGGDWDTASNWSTGQVPGPQNAAVINMPAITVTHASANADFVYSLTSAARDLVLSVGTLSVAARSTIHHLTMTNGFLSGPGLVTINGLVWSGGIMTGGGITDIPAGGFMTITGNETLDTRTLRNEGTATLSGPGTLNVSNSLIDNRAGASFTVQGGPRVVANGASPSQFSNTGTLTVAAGTGMTSLGIPLANNGLLHLTSGTLSVSATEASSGSIILDAGVRLSLYGASSLAQGKITTSTGDIITTTGTLDVAGSLKLSGSGSVTFINNGTVDKTGNDTLTIPAAFINSGNVEVEAGTLSLAGGGSATGSFLVDASTSLNFASPAQSAYALKAGSSVSGAGTVTFELGTTNLGGSYNVTGGTEVAGGTANFTSPVTSVGAIIVAHGTANFSTGSAVTVPSLTIEEATLTGSDHVTVTGSMIWLSGTMSGSGATVIPAGAQLSLMDGTLDTRSLVNQGAVTAAVGSVLSLAHGATVDNQGFSGTWNDQGGNSVSGSGTFDNSNGTYLSSGSGTTSYTVPFNNTGSVEVQAGTLRLGGGGQSNVGELNAGGFFRIDAGALLTFPGGAYIFSTGTLVLGDGFADVTGATVTIAATVNAANFELDSGAIGGPGDLDIGNTFTWTGGNLQGTGMVRLGATALLNVSGNGQYLGLRRIVPAQDLLITPPNSLLLAAYPEQRPSWALPAFLSLGSFSDGSRPGAASAYTATVAWGDGSSSTGTITPNSVGGFDVTSPAHTYTEEGTFNVQVQISENDGETAGTAFNEQVEVTDADLGGVARSATLPAPIKVGTKFGNFTANVATFWDPGSDGTIADYSASVRWGDGATSPGQITLASNGLFNVSAGDAYPGAPLTYTVMITDQGGASTRVSGTLFPAIVSPVVRATPTDFSVAEGTGANVIVATFTGPGTAASYRAGITWLNSDTATNATVQQPTPGGPFQVVTQRSFDTVGHEPFAVDIIRSGSQAAAAGGIATVTEVPLTVTGHNFAGAAGNSVLVVPASFRDPAYSGGQAYRAMIDWGDGTTSGPIAYFNTGAADVSGTHVYAKPGAYCVRVTVLASDGGAVKADSTATISATTVTASVQAVTPFWDVPFTGVVATFRDSQASTNAASYSATIDWRAFPGSIGSDTSAGTIVANNDGSFSVVGTHTYHNFSSFPLYVTITKSTSGVKTVAATILGTANVGVGVHPINLVEGSAYNQPLAAFPLPIPPGGDPSQYGVTINWGDGQSVPDTTAGTVNNEQDPLGDWIVSAPAHVYAEAGSYTVTIVVQNPQGLLVTFAFDTAIIVDGQLTLLNGATGSPVAGYPATLKVATFADQDAAARGTDFAATIDWGDGQTSLATFVPQAFPNPGQADFGLVSNHTYAVHGTYTVSGIVYDVDGASVPFSSSIQVSLPPLKVQGSTFVASAGGAFTQTLATFNAGDQSITESDFSGTTIDWGDGSAPSPVTVAPVAGQPAQFNVTATHTFANAGVYNTNLKIVNSAGPGATVSPRAVVGSAPTVGVGTLAPFLTASLGTLQTDLNSQAFNNPVPLIGSQLKSAAVGQIMTTVKAALSAAFKNLDTSQAYGVQGALFEALGPDGLNVLLPADLSGRAPTIADVGGTQDASGNINYEIHLHLTAGSNTGRVKFDAAMPGFINFNDTAKSVLAQVGYDLDLKFGTSTGANAAPFIATSTLQVPVSANAARMDIPGSLFYLNLDAKDTGSSFNGTYSLSFARPANTSALALVGNPTLTGTGLENLHLDATWNMVPGGINVGAILAALNNLNTFHILSDFNVTWSFQSASTLSAPKSFGNNPVVAFNNVGLDLGSFFSSFAGPILNAIHVVTGPLEGLAEFLLAPIPVLDQISEFFKAGTFNMATLIGLDVNAIATEGSLIPGNNKPSAIDVLNYFANAIEIINHLQVGTTTVTLQLGSFSIKLRDPAPTTPPQDAFDIADWISKAPKDAKTASENLPDATAAKYFQFTHKIKFDVPLIDDPTNAFRILMGDTSIPLFDFKVNLGFKTTSKLIPAVKIAIPLPPPIPTGILDFILNWSINLPSVSFEFGYDEAGLKTGKVLDGFFVKNLAVSVNTSISLGFDLGTGALNIVDVILAVNVSISFGVKVVDTSTIDPKTLQPSTTLRGSSFQHLGIIPADTISGSPFAEVDLFGNCLLKINFGKLTITATGVQIAGITTGC